MENDDEIKIIIKPTDAQGFSIFIVEPKNKVMSAEILSCYTLARGMIKFGLDTPEIAFDYGMLSFKDEQEKTKSNGSKYKDLKKHNNILDITEIIKNRKK